ncbi:MAG TPA: MFS transporter [Burkholderiaceae bacterium]|nr:MFS transporter [Burkholderiaceae bacterium]
MTTATSETPDQSQFALLKQRRFAPFFATQFLGAANDNVFKYAFTLLVTYKASSYTSLSPALAVNLIAALFILPFLLFSATSGQLADKFEKSGLMRLVKVLEVGIMLVAAWGLYAGSFAVLATCVFLMGLHSTLFGPVKYAFLPERLAPNELIGGNGLVEMGTFVAILLGTVAAGILIDASPSGHLYAAAACVALALAGLAASLAIPAGKAADPKLALDWNPIRVTWQTVQVARRQRAVFLSLLGISWLWFFGAVFLTQFPPFAKDVLGGSPSVATLLLAVFSIGIGIGSLACERMSRHQVEIGLVPFGSLGMTVFTVDLYFASRGLPLAGNQTIAQFLGAVAHWRVLADLFLLAMFAGFYSVPLYALIQARAEATHKARIIAANNILNALFLILAAGFAALVLGRGLSIPQLFLLTALLNLVVAVYIYTLVPEFLLRFLSWALVHTIYRVRTQGTERIPLEGPALIVSNHVSFVDALVLMAISPRPIRFVMDLSIFRVPVLSWLFKQVKAIPIASAKVDPTLMERAFERVSEELRDGQLVCIFPEGRITDTGELYPFRPGIARILERDPVPVIPVALQGLWGSFFSRKGGAAMTKPLRRGAFSRIGIRVGEAVGPAFATPEQLQEQVAGLRGEWR